MSHVDSETLEEVTENFEKLLNQYSNLDLVIGTITVGAASYITRITPFIFAYYKNKITRRIWTCD